jgi:hypothetical protein
MARKLRHESRQKSFNLSAASSVHFTVTDHEEPSQMPKTAITNPEQMPIFAKIET